MVCYGKRLFVTIKHWYRRLITGKHNHWTWQQVSDSEFWIAKSNTILITKAFYQPLPY